MLDDCIWKSSLNPSRFSSNPLSQLSLNTVLARGEKAKFNFNVAIHFDCNFHVSPRFYEFFDSFASTCNMKVEVGRPTWRRQIESRVERPFRHGERARNVITAREVSFSATRRQATKHRPFLPDVRRPRCISFFSICRASCSWQWNCENCCCSPWRAKK